MPKLHPNRSAPGKLSSHLLSTTLHPYAHTRIDDLKPAAKSSTSRSGSTTPSTTRRFASRSTDASSINLTSDLDSIEEPKATTDAAVANYMFFTSSSSDDSMPASVSDVPKTSHDDSTTGIATDGDEAVETAVGHRRKVGDASVVAENSQVVGERARTIQVAWSTRKDKHNDIKSSYSAWKHDEGLVDIVGSKENKHTRPRTHSISRAWPRYWTPARSRAREQSIVRDREEMKRKRYPGYCAAKEFFERSPAAKTKKQEEQEGKVDVEAHVGVEGVDVVTVGFVVVGAVGMAALVAPNDMLNVVIAGILMAAPLPDLIPRWSLVVPLLSSFSAQARLEVVLFLMLVSWLSTLNWEYAVDRVETRSGEVFFSDMMEE